MKTLATILAAALLATVATTAYAGDPIPGVDVELCHPITPGCAPHVTKRGTNDFRGSGRKSIRTFTPARTTKALKSGRRVHTPITIVRDPN